MARPTVTIYTEQLSNGVTKYIVRVKRGDGPRRVLGRFDTPNEAVSCAVREYYEHLAKEWIYVDEAAQSSRDY